MRGQRSGRRVRQLMWLAMSVVGFSVSAGAAPEHGSHPAATSPALVDEGRQVTESLLDVRLGVHLHIDRSIESRVILRSLEDETESLWRPYGVQLVWADARDTDAKAGDFSVDANVQRSVLSDWVAVLGRAPIAMDAPSRPIRVSYTATERVLDSRTGGRASTVQLMRDCEMARALGRVLAHEIGHVLLAAPYHDVSGLMRPVFSPHELASPDRTPFCLTRNDVGRLRGRVRVLTGQTSDF
jgi:hypothetical protein